MYSQPYSSTRKYMTSFNLMPCIGLFGCCSGGLEFLFIRLNQSFNDLFSSLSFQRAFLWLTWSPLFWRSFFDLVLLPWYLFYCVRTHVDIRCFQNNQTIKSSLKFLREHQWARDQVEALYLKLKKDWACGLAPSVNAISRQRINRTLAQTLTWANFSLANQTILCWHLTHS